MFLISFVLNKTILHSACLSGNLELVKYIISMNKIDIKSQTVFISLFE